VTGEGAPPTAGVEGTGRAPAAGRRAASISGSGAVERKPPWLRVRLPRAAPFRATAGLLDELELHTVCEAARCPNRGECFGSGTATFLVLGETCTRTCGFCAIGRASAPPAPPDPDEPRRVARAAARLGLAHVVVTSVTRDDLSDGGAAHYAATIAAVRDELPDATVEVLVPDFGGDPAALAVVLAARPRVLNHNLETVPRLYDEVRPRGSYRRSLDLLRAAADAGAAAGRSAGAVRPRLVKSGLMLGLGETADEVAAVLADCAAASVGLVTVGQYLRPAAGCLPVARYLPPGEFAALVPLGERLGLRVEAGPFVRSSYRAAAAFEPSSPTTLGRAPDRTGCRPALSLPTSWAPTRRACSRRSCRGCARRS
jgi:lipoic acid synthetase